MVSKDVYAWFMNDRTININEKDLDKIWFKSHLLNLSPGEKSKKEFLSLFNKKITIPSEIQNLMILININNKHIPTYSTFIQLSLFLRTSFLSKDDDPFYIIDNPIVKDKVFKIPMVRPSTWKGSLRHAAMTIFEEEFNESNWKQKRADIFRLFGSEKEIQSEYLNHLIADKLKKEIQQIEEEFRNFLLEKGYISEKVESRAGRLTFYPTFFSSMSLDVMTPLDRATKTPDKGPIYFEVVPADEKGDFKLMYYPFDLIAEFSGEELETKVRGEQKEDMDLLGKALYRMFYQTGFSAKKTSGYGAAKPIEKTNIQITGFDDDSKEKLVQALCGI